MNLISGIRRLIRGDEPTVVDFEGYQQAGVSATGTEGAYALGGRTDPAVLGRVGPSLPDAGTYKIQQSYDSLLETVRDLREALDGQTKRQEELLSRLATLPQAAEALPQTSRIQADMLKMINDRLSVHLQQQRKIGEVMTAVSEGKAKAGATEALQAIREQIEMGNEIDRQLVESFNRFSMMIDRLQVANIHAMECLQQVRDSYATTALQMQEWIDKSRQRNSWLIGVSFVMSAAALAGVVILLYSLTAPAR